jgi:hypothetical protein
MNMSRGFPDRIFVNHVYRKMVCEDLFLDSRRGGINKSQEFISDDPRRVSSTIFD